MLAMKKASVLLNFVVYGISLYIGADILRHSDTYQLDKLGITLAIGFCFITCIQIARLNPLTKHIFLAMLYTVSACLWIVIIVLNLHHFLDVFF